MNIIQLQKVTKFGVYTFEYQSVLFIIKNKLLCKFSLSFQYMYFETLCPTYCGHASDCNFVIDCNLEIEFNVICLLKLGTVRIAVRSYISSISVFNFIFNASSSRSKFSKCSIHDTMDEISGRTVIRTSPKSF